MRILSLFFCFVLMPLVALAQSDTLTISQKAARLLIVSVEGVSFGDDTRVIEDVCDKGVGGVIFFERNIAAPREGFSPKDNLSDYIARLKSVSKGGLLVTIDQEGGYVNRLKTKYGFDNMISQQRVGVSNDRVLAAKTASLIASEVASVGFNVNFAPCVDVNVNPDCPVIAKNRRSFSSDETKVSQLAAQYVNEHRVRGVLTSLKHFPGHGSSKEDSHLGFTDITNTWAEKELYPYKSLIDNGLCDMVMVSHLYNANIDSEYPASLSKKTINGVLREKLGWDGVVVSDDMQMKAITEHYTFEEAVVLGLNAGIDLFIISNNVQNLNYRVSERFISTIVDAVNRGEVTMERLDEAVARIEGLRAKLIH